MKFENATVYRQILSKSIPFKGVETDVLDELLEHGMVLSAKKDELVFYEHMRGGMGLYIVLDGVIEIFKSRVNDGEESDGKPLHLTNLMPGQCFGEYSLLDGRDTTAAAKALEESKLFLVSRGEFEKLVSKNPEAGRTIYHNLLLFLIDRLRRYP